MKTSLTSACRLLLAALLLAVSQAGTGTTPRFAHITISNGLPHQQVGTIAQDKKGYIWIGTRNGLSRYDGYTLTNYFHDPTDARSLFCNFITCLYADTRGRLWVGTNNGIGLYHPATDSFERKACGIGAVQDIVETSDRRIVAGGSNLYVYDERRGQFALLPLLDRDYVVSLAADRHGRLWVATNHGIGCYTGGLRHMTRVRGLGTASFLDGTDGSIAPMTFDSHDRLWVGRNGKGVLCHDMATGRNTVLDDLDGGQNTVRAITEDRHHNIWLGTEKGLVIIGPDMSRHCIYQDFRKRDLINDNAIYSVLADRSGNMWIGTYFGGVNLYKSSQSLFRWYEPGYDTDNIKGKAVRMMCQPAGGQLWIATEDGGLNVLDTRSGTFTTPLPASTTGRNIHSLCHDTAHGDMWVGTFRGGLFCYNLATHRLRHYLLDHGLRSADIFYMAQQRDGTLWVATTHGLYSYDRRGDRFVPSSAPWLHDAFVYTLCTDDSDNVWAGTAHNGLFCIDKATHRVSQWTCDGKSGLADNSITCLYALPHCVLVGTSNNGLQVLDRRTGRVSWLSDDKVLRTCTVCAIGDDRRGHLWITTSQGLYSYDKSRRTWEHFTEESGLPTGQFNFSSILTASDGLVYAGTVNGLIAFAPGIDHERHNRYNVHLTQLVINNRPMTVGTEGTPLDAPLDDMATLTLSYGQSRSFAIDYGVIMPSGTDGIEYEVMLDGIDRSWRKVGTSRVFTAFDLTPGTYTLMVRASDGNSPWASAPVKTLRIMVRPNVLLSAWALAAYALLLAAGTWLAYRRIMREHDNRLVSCRERLMAVDGVAPDAGGLSDADKALLQRVSALVDDNMGNSSFCIQDATDALGMSRSQLHVKMKSLLNMSMGDYIKKKRLDRACMLLRSGHNVSETAYQTGFSDPNYFSKVFKKYMGVSPTEYLHK